MSRAQFSPEDITGALTEKVVRGRGVGYGGVMGDRTDADGASTRTGTWVRGERVGQGMLRVYALGAKHAYENALMCLEEWCEDHPTDGTVDELAAYMRAYLQDGLTSARKVRGEVHDGSATQR